MNRFGFVIPVYRHGSTLDYVISSLEKFNYPIIVVDDGNTGDDKIFIQEAAEKFPLVNLVVHKKNGGKGRSVNDGIKKAHELGLTHVLQIDSDGQHDISRCKFFFEESEKNPGAVICGYPEYDESVPKARLNGRKIANAWIHIVTVSNEIRDALIGFRIYPVEPYYNLLKHHAVIDSHMGYDTDILVHLSWKNISIISHPVKISYPKDGVSNFRMVRDNIHISLTFTRLCVGMIFRFPVLFFRMIRRNISGASR